MTALAEEGELGLVAVVQELSLARDEATIADIVRRAARRLTGADGAAFVLREGSFCHYVDEEAIGPLWKGRRFPMEACISGWAMIHRQAVAIPDIYADARIPADAYRPTFVKSLLMVPIRTSSPIGAIGNYWATHHDASPREMQVLQALADSTSIAIENVQLYKRLEERVRERTSQLQALNEELEAFAYSVSHDLRAPLRAVDGFSLAIEEDWGDTLDPEARGHLRRVRNATKRMGELIDDLLQLSRLSRSDLCRASLDLSLIGRQVMTVLAEREPARRVELRAPETIDADGDPRLVQLLLENLLDNAWKFTGRASASEIELGMHRDGDRRVYFVRDNGVGFDERFAGRLFAPFQRLHAEADFPGTGIGLATCSRIVRRHGGRIWAESAVAKGATFFFTLDA